MLRTDLIRKLQKTPASESKLTRRSRKKMFEEKKRLNCDNISKSLLNVFESWPENQRITRSMSKSPKEDNLELPKCDNGPKATVDSSPKNQRATRAMSKSPKKDYLELPKCDNGPKATVDSSPKNQRVTRSQSKSPIKPNFEPAKCDNTPNATLSIVDSTPRSECKTSSKMLDKIRARSISSHVINFNDFMAKVTHSDSKSNSNSAIKSKLNVRPSMGREANTPHSIKKVPRAKSLRINLSESAMKAKLLNDESPASLVSSPDQSIATAKDILNTSNPNTTEKVLDDNNLPSVSMLGEQIESNLNGNKDFLSPIIMGHAVQAPNITHLKAFDKVSVADDNLPSVSMLGIQIESDADANASVRKFSLSPCLVSPAVTEATSFLNQLPNENNNDKHTVWIENELDDTRNESYSTAVSEQTYDGKPNGLIPAIPKVLTMIDLTESPIPINKIKTKLNITFSPTEKIETIVVQDDTFTKETSFEQLSASVNNLTLSPNPNENTSQTNNLHKSKSLLVNDLTFSPKPKQNNSQSNILQKSQSIIADQVAGPTGMKNVECKKTAVPTKIVPFHFGNGDLVAGHTKEFSFKMQSTSTPMPVFNKVNKESKIQPNRSSIYSRAETVNRAKLNNNEREERRIAMFENCKRTAVKSPSSEKHQTVIKGVRMNRRMQLLFEKRDAMKKK